MKAITLHLPQADRCPARLWAMATSPQFLLLSRILCCLEYPFGHFGLTAEVLSPPKVFLTFSLLIERSRIGKQKKKQTPNPNKLEAVQALPSNSQNTGVINTAFVTNPKHSTIPDAMKKIKSTPASPSTMTIFIHLFSLYIFSTFIQLFHELLFCI